jgi:hypothetical protein
VVQRSEIVFKKVINHFSGTDIFPVSKISFSGLQYLVILLKFTYTEGVIIKMEHAPCSLQSPSSQPRGTSHLALDINASAVCLNK